MSGSHVLPVLVSSLRCFVFGPLLSRPAISPYCRLSCTIYPGPRFIWRPHSSRVLIARSCLWLARAYRSLVLADARSSAVAFLPTSTSGEPRGGFTLPYTSLTLHALTPASEGSPAHIYCQVDESDAVRLPAGSGEEPLGGMNGHASGGGGDGYGEPEEEYAEMREVRLYVEAEKRE